MTFSCCVFRSVLLKYFFLEFGGFVGPQGLHKYPNGSLWGTLRDQISAQLATLVAPWFQGGSQAPKKEPLWVTWGCLFEVFWSVICMIFDITCNVFFQDCYDFRPYF